MQYRTLASAALILLLPTSMPDDSQPRPIDTGPIDTGLFAASGRHVRSFVRTTTIGAPPEDVYRAWTDGAAFARAYDAGRSELRADIELAIGGKYEWLWDGVTGSNDCQILSYIPGRMLSFSWNAPLSHATRAQRTWVVVEFDAGEGDATEVTLTHLGFGEGEEWDETYAYFRAAWIHVLARFKLGLEG